VGVRGRGEELQALTLCWAFLGEPEEMKQHFKWEVIASLFLFISVSWPGLGGATEIRISPLTAHPGQTIDVPITIDDVDNLAGVKLVMSYDPEILVFKKGAKTKQTDSLMHVVNDKKPGQIIVVMAGARGIKGKNIPIFTLSFDVKKQRTGRS
jgi:hypothetical protein